MNVTQLMLDLWDQGIQLATDGDHLKYHPKSAMSPQLLDRIREHKPLLLSILTAKDVPAAVMWHAALDRVEEEGNFPTDLLDGCRQASARLEHEVSTEICDRYNSKNIRHIPIHGGRSARRECARCGHFLGFSRWHGKESNHEN